MESGPERKEADKIPRDRVRGGKDKVGAADRQLVIGAGSKIRKGYVELEGKNGRTGWAYEGKKGRRRAPRETKGVNHLRKRPVRGGTHDRGDRRGVVDFRKAGRHVQGEEKGNRFMRPAARKKFLVFPLEGGGRKMIAQGGKLRFEQLGRRGGRENQFSNQHRVPCGPLVERLCMHKKEPFPE